MRAKEGEITRLSGLYRQNLEKAGARFVETRARVEGPHAVATADGRQFEAGHILVATGGRPSLPPGIPGLEHAITSNEIFDLKVFPRRLLVVGAGYIGLEFASIFARLGAEVTVAFRGEQILTGFDDDMRAGLADGLRDAGITLLPRTLPKALHWSDGRIEVAMPDGSTPVFDQVLVATGRVPNTLNLGLEAAGVDLDRKGAVRVDPFSASSVPSIHAVGDVTDRINLTPVAVREGHALADTLFGSRPTTVDHDAVASGVFTTPEVGTVGLTEAKARQHHDVVDIYRASFRPLKATLSGPQGEGDVQARRRRHHRSRPRRPYPRARRRRDDPDVRHRGPDGRHQARLRRHHGGPPHHGRGDRHDAQPHGTARAVRLRQRRRRGAVARQRLRRLKPGRTPCRWTPRPNGSWPCWAPAGGPTGRP